MMKASSWLDNNMRERKMEGERNGEGVGQTDRQIDTEKALTPTCMLSINMADTYMCNSLS